MEIKWESLYLREPDMGGEKMIKYISPNIREFETFAALENYANSTYKFFSTEISLSIDQLLDRSRMLILGEPGMGKTRLLTEMVKRANEQGKKALYLDLKRVENNNLITHIRNLTASKKQLSKDIENAEVFGSDDFELSNETPGILCLDALDEVLTTHLSGISDGIQEILNRYPQMAVYCSCRKNHYTTLPTGIFGRFSYVYIDIFSIDQVRTFLETNEIREETIVEIMSLLRFKNRDLIIQIPRYLHMVLVILKENGGVVDRSTFSRCNIFEHFTYKILELEASRDPGQLSQKTELIKRVLEKIALVMEIYQTNIITKDELMSFFDDIHSNLSTSFLSQIDIKTFYERSLLKDNFDGTIQFENTEIQEYLAAKEIVRLEHLEQTVFDLSVDPELREIYPSWINTLDFIVELKPNLATSIIQLSYGKSNTVQDEEYHKLVSGVNRDALSLDERNFIFLQIFNYYQKTAEFLSLGVAANLGRLYNDSLRDIIVNSLRNEKIDKLTCFQQENVTEIIAYIMEENPSEVDFWKQKLLALPYKENIKLSKSIIFALGKAKDISQLAIIAEPLLYTGNEIIIQNIISACIEAEPNHNFSIRSYIEGTKKDQIIARYGIYKVKNVEAIELILSKLIEDGEFRSKFIEDESVFKDKDKIIGNNIFAVWNEKLEQKVLELIQTLLSNREAWITERSKLLNYILALAQAQDSRFILRLSNYLVTTNCLDGYYCSRLLAPLLSKDGVIKFVEMLSTTEDGREVALRTLQYKSFFNDAASIDTYEEGRKHFEQEYRDFETRQNSSGPSISKDENRLSESFKFQLEPEPGKYDQNVFSFYYRHRNELEATGAELERLKDLVVNSILEIFDPSETKLTITKKTGQGREYTTHSFIETFGACLPLIELLGIDNTKYRQKIINFIPFADPEELEIIFRLVPSIRDNEIDQLLSVYSNNRLDDLALLMPENFIGASAKYNNKKVIPVLKKFIESDTFDVHIKTQALKVICTIEPDETYLKNVFETHIIKETVELAELANELLISVYNDWNAVTWRVGELIKRVFEFTRKDKEHRVGKREYELNHKEFASPLMNLADPIYIDIMDKLAFSAFEVYGRGLKYREYSRYLWEIVISFYINLKQTRSYIYLQKFISQIESRFGQHEGFFELSYRFQTVKQTYLNYLGKPVSFSDCIKTYNRLKENQYLGVTNARELLEVVLSVLDNDFMKWVEAEGAYRFIQEATRHQEDLIQKTIKTQIENGLLKRGLRFAKLRREEQLLDDKRPDMLITYGFIGPILIEIKRVDNREVYNDEERNRYREKLLQYLRATEAPFGLYLAFQINNNYSMIEYVPKLIDTYKDIKNVIVKGYNCIKQLPTLDSALKNSVAQVRPATQEVVHVSTGENNQKKSKRAIKQTK